MKRLLLLALCLSVMMNIQAQVDESESSIATTNSSTQSTQQKQYDNSTALDIRIVDDGFGIGVNYIFKGMLCLGYFRDFYKDQKPADGIEINNIADNGFYLGLNYRHWLTQNFFVEGQAGAGFFIATASTMTKVPNYTTTGYVYTTWQSSSNTNSDYFIYITPRIGYKFFEGKSGMAWSFTLGYRCDAPKGKFGDATSKGLTLGVSVDI